MIQNPSYYKRVNADSGRRRRKGFYFDSITDFNRFIDEIESTCDGRCRRGFDRLNEPNYKRSRARDREWYGTTDVSLVNNNIQTYLYNDELGNFIQTLRDRTVSIDKTDLDQIKTIKFTEQEIGIFSFDLASLGLIPVIEFYSPLLKRVVSGNNVLCEKDENNVPIKDSNGNLKFYHIEKPEIPEHIVEFNAALNGYYSTILDRVVTENEISLNENNQFVFNYQPKIKRHKVERKQKEENGKKKWATTFKKSFVYLPKVEKPLPRIDIIVGCSFAAGEKARTELLYNCMGAITLAEKLSKARVNYRILVGYGIQNDAGNQAIGFVCAKKESEPLDTNKMAVLMSDCRFARWQAFRSYYALQYDSGWDSDINVSSIGYIIDNATTIKDVYLEYLKNSDDPTDKLSATRPDTKIVFNGARNMLQATNEYNRVVQQISNVI